MLITLILRTIKPLCRIDEPNKPIRGRVKEEKCLNFFDGRTWFLSARIE